MTIDKNNLFTTQLYAVNNTLLEYIFIELYNGVTIDMNQIFKQTTWKIHHNIVFCNSNSLFWKYELNKLIDCGYLNMKKYNIDNNLVKCYDCYINVGIVPIFNLPMIKEEDETDVLINHINEIIDFHMIVN